MSPQSWLLVAIISPIAVAVLIPVAKWAMRVFAGALGRELRHYLNLDEIESDIDYIKNELTINGGDTVKDRLLTIEALLAEQ